MGRCCLARQFQPALSCAACVHLQVDAGELGRALTVLHRITQHARPSDGSNADEDADWKAGDGPGFDAVVVRLLCGLESARAIILVSIPIRAPFQYCYIYTRKRGFVPVPACVASSVSVAGVMFAPSLFAPRRSRVAKPSSAASPGMTTSLTLLTCCESQ